MHIYLNVILVIFSLLGIIAVLYLINLVMTFTALIDAKKQDITIKSNRLGSAGLLNKCEATAAILKIIDIVIDLEIAQVISTYTALNKKYEINRLTDDVSTISMNVYNAIKKEIYLNEDCVFNEEYLMTYITNIVTVNLIQQAKGLNSVIYEEK